MAVQKASSSNKGTKKGSKPAARPSASSKKTQPSKGQEKQSAKASSSKNAAGHHSAAPSSSSSKKSSKQKSGSSQQKRASGFNSKSILETNAAGETVCREVACEGLSTSGGYCRLHYIKNWKKIKRKEAILREGKLNQYIEELITKYPDKYIEAIRQDLASDKDFSKVIYDLDLDEGIDDFDVDAAESADSLIDNIKREFEDEGEPY